MFSYEILNFYSTGGGTVLKPRGDDESDDYHDHEEYDDYEDSQALGLTSNKRDVGHRRGALSRMADRFVGRLLRKTGLQ